MPLHAVTEMSHMMTRTLTAMAIGLIVSIGYQAAAEEIQLFNGTNLDGWEIINNGQFSVKVRRSED